jgi:MATE family multidrug resistance protein
MFIGHVGDSTTLAAVGIGNMIVNLMPYSIMIGVNSALETFVSQAYGRKNYKDCGLYLHRASFVITVLFVPTMFCIYHSAIVMEALGMDKEASRLACNYAIALGPAAYFNSLGDAIDLFLTAMGSSYIIMVFQAFMIPMHYAWTWFFVVYMDWGLMGAAYGNNLGAIVNFFIQVIYAGSIKEFSEAWYWPTKRTFNNLRPFLALAIPGILMLFVENLNMEILVLLAG